MGNTQASQAIEYGVSKGLRDIYSAKSRQTGRGKALSGPPPESFPLACPSARMPTPVI